MKNDNILLIDKPAGMTSHDVVDKVRITTGEKKVGHAGTLDPAATGLLIVLVGREATKRQSEFMKQDKVYEAEIILGAVSDTYDGEGKIQVLSIKNLVLSREKIQEVVEKKFTGEIEQVPPIYSAIKVKGKKLYEYARQGQKVEVKPRKVEIYEIKICHPERLSVCHCERSQQAERGNLRDCRVGSTLLAMTEGSEHDTLYHLHLRIHCSSGTYIRSIAHDLGQMLGCGGYLNQLRRVKIGQFSIDNAVSLENLERKVKSKK